MAQSKTLFFSGSNFIDKNQDIFGYSMYLSRWSKTTNSRKDSLKSFTANPYYTHLKFWLVLHNSRFVLYCLMLVSCIILNLIIINESNDALDSKMGRFVPQHRRLKAFFHPISTRLNYTPHNKNNQGITISQKKNKNRNHYKYIQMN